MRSNHTAMDAATTGVVRTDSAEGLVLSDVIKNYSSDYAQYAVVGFQKRSIQWSDNSLVNWRIFDCMTSLSLEVKLRN
ncbi:hypothetical protein LSAT2_030024 [Lamellibrachia satsuma]|nr:hypothetical protein LSAT2_030024 [Lamellibrachia satsuma]